MTVRELINKLLDQPMDAEAYLRYDKEHTDEYGHTSSGYGFKIDGVDGTDILFTDWRDPDVVKPTHDCDECKYGDPNAILPEPCMHCIDRSCFTLK